VKKTVAPPPIVYGGMTLGPFARGSSTLTPGLKSQISDIAGDVRSQHKFQIALLGFGDTLPGTGTSSSKNVALGRARARAVASYLQGRLSALSLKGGWSISIGAVGTGKTNSGQIESALVSVTLS
jgi:outer membrane protein OmpA-like peptidoglycan-associated protein